jgi:hypothetical protein
MKPSLPCTPGRYARLILLLGLLLASGGNQRLVLCVGAGGHLAVETVAGGCCEADSASDTADSCTMACAVACDDSWHHSTSAHCPPCVDLPLGASAEAISHSPVREGASQAHVWACHATTAEGTVQARLLQLKSEDLPAAGPVPALVRTSVLLI